MRLLNVKDTSKKDIFIEHVNGEMEKIVLEAEMRTNIGAMCIIYK